MITIRILLVILGYASECCQDGEKTVHMYSEYPRDAVFSLVDQFVKQGQSKYAQIHLRYAFYITFLLASLETNKREIFFQSREKELSYKT